MMPRFPDFGQGYACTTWPSLPTKPQLYSVCWNLCSAASAILIMAISGL